MLVKTSCFQQEVLSLTTLRNAPPHATDLGILIVANGDFWEDLSLANECFETQDLHPLHAPVRSEDLRVYILEGLLHLVL